MNRNVIVNVTQVAALLRAELIAERGTQVARIAMGYHQEYLDAAEKRITILAEVESLLARAALAVKDLK